MSEGVPTTDDGPLEQRLDQVRERMMEVLTRTAIGPLVREYHRLIASGKMLRSRLVLRVGPVTGLPEKAEVDACTAIELIHAASLLHDDVIDGGYLRRGLPAFWVERGIPGAILLGDLMLFKALDLITGADPGGWMAEVIRQTGDVCEAESEQELLMRGPPSTWEACVDIARRKTGSLFALAAMVAAGPDPILLPELKECGYDVGTAYQLADDFLDANGDTETAGKTLGSDEARDKANAARVAAASGIEVGPFLENLLARSVERLGRWPRVQRAWESYLAHDFRPALERNLMSGTRL